MDTKKIALMTWHHTENYGTAFQAYALKTILEELNCTVDLIDHRRTDDSPPRVQSLSELTMTKVRSFFRRSAKNTRTMYQFAPHKFSDFWEGLFSYTAPCTSDQDFEKICEGYHGFICGSDQIWGPEWFDARYFLDFVEDPSRKIAYAPSFGVSELEDPSAASSMSRLIRDFADLSVREKSGCVIVEQLTGRKDTKHVLDPVLLLDARKWDALADEKTRLPSKPYMFIFFLKNDPHYFQTAIEKAKELGIAPIIMHSTQSEDNLFANLDAPTPQGLLAYIRSAAYVCTDSFHMTVLSILFNVQFQAFKKNGTHEPNEKNGRITDLLDRLSIKGHVYRKGASFGDTIDYRDVDRALEHLRASSISYLKQAIEKLPDEPCLHTVGKQCGCHKNDCKGDLHKSFLKRWNGPCGARELRLLKEMKPWNFTLEDKCYRCRFFQPGEGCANLRKPLFYYDLAADLENEHISTWHIYRKYYLSYTLRKRLKRRNYAAPVHKR